MWQEKVLLLLVNAAVRLQKFGNSDVVKSCSQPFLKGDSVNHSETLVVKHCSMYEAC